MPLGFFHFINPMTGGNDSSPSLLNSVMWRWVFSIINLSFNSTISSMYLRTASNLSRLISVLALQIYVRISFFALLFEEGLRTNSLAFCQFGIWESHMYLLLSFRRGLVVDRVSFVNLAYLSVEWQPEFEKLFEVLVLVMILWVTINSAGQKLIVKPLQHLGWFLVFHLVKPLAAYQLLIRRFFVFMNFALWFVYHCLSYRSVMAASSSANRPNNI